MQDVKNKKYFSPPTCKQINAINFYKKGKPINISLYSLFVFLNN